MHQTFCPSPARVVFLCRITCRITFLIASLSIFSIGTVTASPVLAEAGMPIRFTDRSIDIPATIAALQREQVNTYLYQIWRTAGDWDQLRVR